MVVSADLLQKNVEIKKRKYHLRSYERSFVGSEAVQWLVSSGSVEVPVQTLRDGCSRASSCS